MCLQLDRVIPWGRSLDEYRRMFSLTDGDLQKSLIGCADGPASFNAELSRLNGRVVSFDPIYRLAGNEIRRRFDESAADVLAQVKQRQEAYVWTYHRDIEDLRRNRVRALELFLDDYDSGKSQGRYQIASFPRTRFRTSQFDLALCSHFLFLYSDLFSCDFHLQSLREMCRMAAETRVFPLVGLDGVRSRHLDPAREEMERLGFATRIEKVNYELQRGANEMLRILTPQRDRP